MPGTRQYLKFVKESANMQAALRSRCPLLNFSVQGADGNVGRTVLDLVWVKSLVTVNGKEFCSQMGIDRKLLETAKIEEVVEAIVGNTAHSLMVAITNPPDWAGSEEENGGADENDTTAGAVGKGPNSGA